MSTASVPGPTLGDALSLLSEVADELVVRTVRDTHLAWVDRVGSTLHGAARRRSPGESLHRGIAGAVYGGLGLGLRAASRGFDLVADHAPPFETGPRTRFVNSAVNGLIGDRLLQERPQLAIPMAVRANGGDVDLERHDLAAAFPDAGGQVVVFLHGLCENESYWRRGRGERGTTYAETLAARGWTPVFLRANTGLTLRENGAALTALLQRLVDSWPAEVEQLALVGHSMGGLIMRAAAAVASDAEAPWTALVSDVVTLGAPHFGSPVAHRVGTGAVRLARLPETAAFGRILEWRSAGVHDLVEGLGEDIAPLPHARYRLVSATLTRSARHPVGQFVGDLLVRQSSAYGRRGAADLFPGAEVLHVGGADHFDLLNHPEVETALLRWLA
jgi:pimeloyl-ACP methyl ester carboxylesterase